MTQSKSSLLDQILETQKDASINVDEVPRAVRSGFEMRRNQAEIALPGLIDQLKKETVPSRLVGIIATGDTATISSVVAFLKENGGIVLDASALYKAVADKLEPTFSSDREFKTNQHMGAILKCEELGKPAGVKKVVLDFIEGFCHTFEDSVAHCRRLIRASVGDTLNVAILAKDAIDQVIVDKLSDPKLPVIVIGSQEDELPALRSLFSKSCVHNFVASEEAVNHDSIVAILKTAQ